MCFEETEGGEGQAQPPVGIRVGAEEWELARGAGQLSVLEAPCTHISAGTLRDTEVLARYDTEVDSPQRKA
eukprot:1084727-Rhodomonas_salina.4